MRPRPLEAMVASFRALPRRVAAVSLARPAIIAAFPLAVPYERGLAAQRRDACMARRGHFSFTRSSWTQCGATVEASTSSANAAESTPNCDELLGTKVIDSWASRSQALGHAYNPAGCDDLVELGEGVEVPTGWAVKLLTVCGEKGGGTPNQDAVSYTLLENGWMVYVTADGHGENGEEISGRVARMLPLLLERFMQDLGPTEALREAFEAAQVDLELFGPMIQVYSGSTVSVCCIHRESAQVLLAHAGDSSIVLGDLTGGAVIFQTNDHKAHNQFEYKRLQAAGAQVIQKHYSDGEVVSRVFVPRTGVPGLAMSRSLGDGCLKNYGVIAEPEINDVSSLWRECHNPAVVLASDGLWDVFSPEETLRAFAARSQRGRDITEGVETLCRRARRRWIEAEGDYCDDVTLILVAGPSALS